METGVSTPFALVALEERGRLFVGPQEDIYEGQIVGENPRQMDMPVNPCKEKHLNNIRSATKGDGIQLSPPVIFLWNVPLSTLNLMNWWRLRLILSVCASAS